MKDIKIKDAQLVSTVTGNEKIPVSNGSGLPAAITVNLILSKVSNPDLNEYVTKSELANKGYLTQHQDLSDYAKKSDIPTDYLKEIPSEYITENELTTKGYITKDEIPTDYISGNITSIKYVSELPELPEANTLYLVI